MKKNCKDLVKKNLEQKKYLQVKVINCMSNGKGRKGDKLYVKWKGQKR